MIGPIIKGVLFVIWWSALANERLRSLRLDDKYTFTNISNDDFEEKGRHNSNGNDDDGNDGKKPNE